MKYEIKWSGDRMVSVYYEERIDEVINSQVNALKRELLQLNIHGIDAVMSTYHTVSICYDAFKINRETLVHHITALCSSDFPNHKSDNNVVIIPVLYDGEDLERVAKYSGITVEEVIKRHSAVEYHIYMLGFSPGFPYLGGMDQTIATPRLQTPRLKIESGSVGIADRQTGIYPIESPGGWNLIGRTPLNLFTPENHNPFLLSSGQTIRFTAIDQNQFKKISESGGSPYVSKN